MLVLGGSRPLDDLEDAAAEETERLALFRACVMLERVS